MTTEVAKAQPRDYPLLLYYALHRTIEDYNIPLRYGIVWNL